MYLDITPSRRRRYSETQQQPQAHHKTGNSSKPKDVGICTESHSVTHTVDTLSTLHTQLTPALATQWVVCSYFLCSTVPN